MIAVDPQATFDVQLAAPKPTAVFEFALDSKRKDKKAPVLLGRYLAAEDWLKANATLDAAAEPGTAADACVHNWTKAAEIVLTGWRNVCDRKGKPIPFAPDRLADVLRLDELATIAAQLLTVTTRPLSEIPAGDVEKITFRCHYLTAREWLTLTNHLQDAGADADPRRKIETLTAAAIVGLAETKMTPARLAARLRIPELAALPEHILAGSRMTEEDRKKSARSSGGRTTKASAPTALTASA